MRFLPPIVLLASVLAAPAARADRTDVMLQYFEWNLPNDGAHWRKLEREAKELARAGFTALWLPPASKGASGTNDVGYGPYDPYDLGEFDQKGSVRTKYGTKAEYLRAIAAAHRAGISVLADAVMNHAAGADGVERARAIRVDPRDRNREIGHEIEVSAYTRFDYAARKGKYSSFKWTIEHFNGADSLASPRENGQIYLFRTNGRRGWNWEVDPENGNYDYLLFDDVDLGHPAVRRHWADWGRWMIREAGVDGFRIDAAKHMQFDFVRDWASDVREAKRDAFVVAEYWSADLGRLRHYLAETRRRVSLFDFVLQARLADVSRGRGAADLGKLGGDTLTKVESARSVTFVDNHDTERYRAAPGRDRRTTSTEAWFKPAAYAFILLRRDGFPCVFYPDYFGPHRKALDRLLETRKRYAHGPQHDFLADPDVIGWTREGEGANRRALAVVMTDRFSFGARDSSYKRMFVGKRGANRAFRDLTGNVGTKVSVGADGWGDFPVLAASGSRPGRGLSLWVEE